MACRGVSTLRPGAGPDGLCPEGRNLLIPPAGTTVGCGLTRVPRFSVVVAFGVVIRGAAEVPGEVEGQRR